MKAVDSESAGDSYDAFDSEANLSNDDMDSIIKSVLDDASTSSKRRKISQAKKRSSYITAELHEEVSIKDCEDEEYSEEARYLRILLSIVPDHQFVEDNLDDVNILRRGIRLLYRTRMGKQAFAESASIHILYDQLHEAQAT